MFGFKMQQVKQNINITGNRVLFILSLLLRKSLTKEEIMDLISKNPELKPVGADTIRLDMNTLREAGFIIENSTRSYKYNLLWTPIKINFKKSEIKLLNKMKKAALETWDWSSLLNLYKTFEKLSKYIEDEDLKEELLNFNNFRFVDFKLLIELDYHCREKNEIVLEYDSPKGDIMDIHLKCLEIRLNHDTQKLYLYCKFPGYKDTSYLRLDKIIRIKNVIQERTIEEPISKTLSYKLKNEAKDNFVLAENEKIIGEDENFITIEAQTKNNFHFIQRLMVFGEDAICDEPEIKEEILKNLLKTKEIYK